MITSSKAFKKNTDEICKVSASVLRSLADIKFKQVCEASLA